MLGVIRNIIFDWSGTLVDDLPAVLKASNFVLAQAGRPEMSLEQFRAEFSLPFTNFYNRYTDVWDKREKIHEIFAENNLQPDETMFIVDMEHDVETARHGGIHSCAVLT